MCCVCLQTRIYADEDNVRKEEIAALRGENMYRCSTPTRLGRAISQRACSHMSV